MQPLYFSCNWTKGPKEYSWSGTNWALYSHLTKHFEMHDIPTGFRHNGIFFLAVGAMNKVRQMLFSRDMDMARMRIMSRVVRQRIPEDADVFQFDECPAIGIGRRHFIYQDLAVCHLTALAKEHPNVFAVSGYQDISRETMTRRESQQMSFYEKTDGILLMGHWQAEELVKKFGLPKEKIYQIGGGTTSMRKRFDQMNETDAASFSLGETLSARMDLSLYRRFVSCMNGIWRRSSTLWGRWMFRFMRMVSTPSAL